MSVKKKLIIFGEGDLAKLAAEIVREFKLFEIESFAVHKKFKKKKNYNELSCN